jgi:hypothetical protein
MITLSIVHWLSWSAAITLLLTYAVPKDNSTVAFILGTSAHVIITILAYAFTWRLPTVKKGSKKVRKWIVLLRGSLACITVTGGVALSLVSELVGSIVSIFPAIFLTVLISTTVFQGHKVCENALGSLAIATIQFSIMSYLAGLIMPILDLTNGILVVIAVTVFGFSIPNSFYYRWRKNLYRNKVEVNRTTEVVVAQV